MVEPFFKPKTKSEKAFVGDLLGLVEKWMDKLYGLLRA